MSAPDLAVVVASFQLPWHLLRVLESIALQKTSRRLEVVISDDGSTDETPDVVAKFAASAPFPVRFVTHAHRGFHAARCRNQGARHSAAPHLLFVDGDCVLPPDHIEQHLRAWRPGIVTCGYCVRFDKATSDRVTLDAVKSGEFARWASFEERRTLWQMHLKSRLYGMIRHPTKPGFRSGDFSITRTDFERVNGFDENYFGWGCEDDDFGLRLRGAGMRLLSVLDRTWSYHLWHPPAPSWPEQWRRGANVAYFKRPIRLTRCLNGFCVRTRKDLTVRLTGTTVDGPSVRHLVARHGWTVERLAQTPADIELICQGGRGVFSGCGDCRVLAVFDEEQATPQGMRRAHVVLSPSGTVGRRDQLRLRLDDVTTFWDALNCGVRLSREREEWQNATQEGMELARAF